MKDTVQKETQIKTVCDANVQFIKQLLKKLHGLYVDTARNPFADVTQTLETSNFQAAVLKILDS